MKKNLLKWLLIPSFAISATALIVPTVLSCGNYYNKNTINIKLNVAKENSLINLGWVTDDNNTTIHLRANKIYKLEGLNYEGKSVFITPSISGSKKLEDKNILNEIAKNIIVNTEFHFLNREGKIMSLYSNSASGTLASVANNYSEAISISTDQSSKLYNGDYNKGSAHFKISPKSFKIGEKKYNIIVDEPNIVIPFIFEIVPPM